MFCRFATKATLLLSLLSAPVYANYQDVCFRRTSVPIVETNHGWLIVAGLSVAAALIGIGAAVVNKFRESK